jgi:Flp pilus assembly protein CpaB
MVVLAVGGTAAAVKMSQKDAQRVEEHTGASVEELTEDELVAAMKDLGIQSIELTDEDKAAVVREGGLEEEGIEEEEEDDAAAPAAEADYLDELERLGTLHDRGIITEEEFQAKKKQLLGL